MAGRHSREVGARNRETRPDLADVKPETTKGRSALLRQAAQSFLCEVTTMISGTRTSAARNVPAGKSADVLRLLRTGEYARRNRETAGIILRDVPRCGGEEAGLVRWARLVMSGGAPAPGGSR